MEKQTLQEKHVKHYQNTCGLHRKMNLEFHKDRMKYDDILPYYKKMMYHFNLLNTKSLSHTIENLGLIVCYAQELLLVNKSDTFEVNDFMLIKCSNQIAECINQCLVFDVAKSAEKVVKACQSYMYALIKNIDEEHEVILKTIDIVMHACIDSLLSREHTSLPGVQWIMAADYLKSIGLEPNAEVAEKNLMFVDRPNGAFECRYWGETSRKIDEHTEILMRPKSSIPGKKITYQIRGRLGKFYTLIKFDGSETKIVNGPFTKKPGISI